MKKLIFLGLCLLILLGTAKQINLITSDLGRHLMNGKMLFENSQLLHQNFYSFTEPEHPFINHHWGAGFIFYGVKSVFGWGGLSVFYVGLILLSFLTLFFASVNMTAVWPSLLTAFFMLPLMICRTDIRPEVFSYLGCSVFLAVLSRWNAQRMSNWALFTILPLIAAFWTNLHIYFFLGWIIIGSFIFGARSRNQIKTLLGCLVLCILASAINPFGLKLLLYPFQILISYPYPVAENNSIFRMFEYIYPLLVSVGLGLVFIVYGIISGIRAKSKDSLWQTLIALAALFLATFSVRNLAIFGFLAFLPTAYGMNFFLARYATLMPSREKRLIKIALGGYTLFFLSVICPEFSHNFGVGLPPQANASVEFFKKNQVSGPIFNNYDIGNYLIYSFFPEQKVFIDARPEAYSEQFVENSYIAMQDDEQMWNEKSKYYSFNAIYFYLFDNTSWGHSFIKRRILDPAWVPVYLDPNVIILLKDIPKNAKVIRRFQLPRDFLKKGEAL